MNNYAHDQNILLSIRTKRFLDDFTVGNKKLLYPNMKIFHYVYIKAARKGNFSLHKTIRFKHGAYCTVCPVMSISFMTTMLRKTSHVFNVR